MTEGRDSDTDALARRKRLIHEEWQKIDKFLEPDDTGLSGVSDAHLGATLREYVRESIHDGWEGFQSRDVTSIRRFLLDLILYHKARTS